MIIDAINLLIICAFAFIPLLLGERARMKSQGSSEDFILQGRRMKLFPMYATVFATWMSAFAFMGGVSYFFEQGPIYMTTVGWDMLFGVLFILIGRRIWHYGKTYGYMTATDFFDGMYGSEILNLTVTAITILFSMVYLQAQIAGAVIVIQVGTGGVIPTYTGGIIFFTILVIYLWEGGLRAVAMTDIFYGILIVTAMITTGIFLMRTAGGTEEVFEEIIARDPLHVSMSRGTGKEQIAMWICLFLVIPIGAFMGPQIWIRNYASGSSRNFTALPLLLGISSIICIGTLFSGSAGILLAKDTDSAPTIIMDLMRETAHPFFYVFVVAGIFAAIFSTSNSLVHGLSAVFTIDIHKRYVNSKVPDRRQVAMAKVAILGISLISYILMIWLPRNVFDLAVFGLGGLAQLIVPVAGALFWKRSSAKGALLALVTGELAFFALLLATELDASICAVLALIMNVALFALISRGTIPDVSLSRRIEVRRREYQSRDY